MPGMTPAKVWSALDADGPITASALAEYIPTRTARARIMCNVLVEVGAATSEGEWPTVYRTLPMPEDTPSRVAIWKDARRLWKERRPGGVDVSPGA